MLTREQVQSYRRDGYLLVENALSPRELATLRQVTDELVAASACRHGAQSRLRPRADPHAPDAARPPDQGTAQRASGLPGHRVQQEDRGHPDAADRSLRPPLPDRQAQHEVGRLRRGGGVAPGLGLLSAHQRRPVGHRALSRRLRAGQRPAHGDPGKPHRADRRPPQRRCLLRRDRSGRLGHRLLEGRHAHRPGGQHDHPPRADGSRLGAEHLRPPAPAPPVPVHGGRRLPAPGHSELGEVQRQHRDRRADHGAAADPRPGADPACRSQPSRAPSTRTSARWPTATSTSTRSGRRSRSRTGRDRLAARSEGSRRRDRRQPGPRCWCRGAGDRTRRAGRPRTG